MEPAQFRRVWRFDIEPRLVRFILELENFIRPEDGAKTTRQRLQEEGFTNESLRLTHDLIEKDSSKGLLGRVFKLVNIALGSLGEIFGYLKAVKEFKEKVEHRVQVLSEPARSKFTTLFGGGPIP